MSQQLDFFTRRILTFPAVCPCESVSPATLLASSITLAGKICDYRLRLFSSNRRNARESIRIVGVLLVFLEEIRDRRLNFPVSITLSLSELHVAFKKIQYLLEDCTREGARLWMLMNSERVSSQFRMFSLSIATALDVFPMQSVDVSIEVKEMVELVIKQTRKSRFEIEIDDALALKEVESALNLFEKMSEPDCANLKTVLNHLAIERWSECNLEIKFLDTEIGFNSSNAAEKKTLTFLSNLMAFVSYCRCVMFESTDAQSRPSSDKVGISETLNCLNTDDFRCPISLEFMVDPVTISTGHTYERSSIQKWFKSGNPTCPKTGGKLTNEDFVPNLALLHLIRQHCSDNGIVIPGIGGLNRRTVHTVHAGGAVAEGSMKLIARFLAGKLANGTIQQRIKAAHEIRFLTKTSIFNRSCLAEAGTIPHLLNLLTSTEPFSQENSIAALLNLSKHPTSKSIIVRNGGILLILDVMKTGQRMEARQHAAGVLFYLSSVEEYRKLIGDSSESIPALVDLIQHGSNSAKKNALVTIFALLMHQNNHWRVHSAGTVSILINLIKSTESEDIISDSLAVLSNLAEKEDGSIAILLRGGLNLVLEILISSDSRTVKEYCVSMLLALCVNGGSEVVSILVKNQSLMVSLYNQLTEGTSRARKKSSSIIRILHEFNQNSFGFKIQQSVSVR